MPLTFLWILLVAMSIGVPVVFALAFAPMVGFVLIDNWTFMQILPQRIYAGINQFPLLAVPLFILAGELMNVGGITIRLVNFANALVGHLRGGLAHVNIVASILFAGLSGSAVADTSALGSILIPAMEKDGYSRKFAAAVTAASSVIGPIIPPSIIMVVYGFIMSVSVGTLFLAGFIPGLLMGVGLMIATAIISKRRNYPRKEKMASPRELAVAFRGAFFPLMTPVIIIGGILSGIFTPTEAAGVAVVYALLLSILVTRTLKFSDLPRVLLRTGIAASAILLIVGTAMAFGWITAVSGVANKLADFVFAYTKDPLLLLFFINVLLLIIGMFFDAGPAIMILGPIVAPVMIELGVHPIHFAIIMCVNLTVGLATPPLGLVLFVASSISKLKVEVIAKELLPFLGIHIIVIFLITYIPAISMTIPRWAGMVP